MASEDPAELDFGELEIDEYNGYATYHGEPADGVFVERGAGRRLLSTVEYVDGDKDGRARTYYPDERLREESRYVMGSGPVGLQRVWHPNGRLAAEYEWRLGSVVRFRKWSESGELVAGTNEPPKDFRTSR